MQAIKKKLKRIIKLFITYKIENDTRVYQLKYTPFTVKKSLIKKLTLNLQIILLNYFLFLTFNFNFIIN